MYFEDMKIGMSRSLGETTVRREDMLDFANKYDNVPLHTDEEYAAGTHFGGIIAPGVFSFMIIWAHYLENSFDGEELLAGKSTKIEWFAPVRAGDVLSGEARISQLTSRNEKNGIAEVTIDVYNASGEKVLSDVTEAIVKKRVPNRKVLG